MYKYNKYDSGDKVRHVKAPELIFEVVDVLTPIPEKIGEYLYSCKLIIERKKKNAPIGWATAEELAEDLKNTNVEQIGKVFKYKENDLSPLRLPGFLVPELEIFLQEALDKEEYEKAGFIQDELNKQKTVS